MHWKNYTSRLHVSKLPVRCLFRNNTRLFLLAFVDVSLQMQIGRRFYLFWEWKYSEFVIRCFWLVTCNFILRRRTKQRSQRLTRASFCSGRCKVNDRHSEPLSSACGWRWLRTGFARTLGSRFEFRSGHDVAHSQACRWKRIPRRMGKCHWSYLVIVIIFWRCKYRRHP